MDGFAIAAIVSELNQVLAGSRIQKIQQPTPWEIHLLVRNQGQNYRLLLSAHPKWARLHVSRWQKINPLSPPMFCMVMRKHLEGGKILQFNQEGFERVVEILIENTDELGQLAQRRLLVEIMGKHSNIILVDPVSNLIYDGIKRYTHAVSRHREVLPGRPYLPPPPQEKAIPGHILEEEWGPLLLAAGENLTLSQALQKTVAGFSPKRAADLVKKAGLDPDFPLDQVGNYELTKTWLALQDLLAELGKGPHPLYYNYLADAEYQRLEAEEILHSQRQNLLRLVKEEINRLQKRREFQEKALAEAASGEKYKLYGDLLAAHLYQWQPGLTELTVPNYYDPELKPLTIPLQPELTASEQVEHFYKKYGKLRSAERMATEQLETIIRDLQYWESVATNLENAEDARVLAEIREEMAAAGLLKQTGRQRKPEKAEEISQPTRFKTRDGYLFLVGRNNRQNDYLTLRLARSEDYWFHTRDIPGSHVILKWNSPDPPPAELLQTGALLAAWFSKARHSSQVPVDYTQRKNVKKPRGAKPGFVIYEQQKTLYVNPGPEILTRLTTTKEDENED
ncbi:MAG: Rqc2 family fibronectin-binding protein [Bacillota bacterium]